MKETFEQYLQSIHSEQYIGIKDNMSDDFDNWLGDLDGQEYMDYAELWGKENLEKLIEDIPPIISAEVGWSVTKKNLVKQLRDKWL